MAILPTYVATVKPNSLGELIRARSGISLSSVLYANCTVSFLSFYS